MKNLTMITLVCLALPAATFGQITVDCTECTHYVSVYQGSGGFIAETDEDEISVLARCGSAVTSMDDVEAEDGKVAMLFTEANGLACDDDSEGNHLQVGPVNDGGWFWITDDMNSAVGNLIDKDTYEALKDDVTMPTDAGDSVTVTEGRGAWFLKQGATGRVGILPSILPMVPDDPPPLCGPRLSAVTKAYTNQQAGNCTMGNGGTKIRLAGTDRYGLPTMLMNGARLLRPVGDTTYTITADLWLNESGSYSTATPPVPALGWIGKGGTAGTNWLDATWGATISGVGTVPPTTADHGVVVSDGAGSTPAGQATVTIGGAAAFEAYCPATGTKTDLTVVLTAAPGDNDVHPPVRTTSASAAERRVSFTVVCPSASAANMGTDLVPENPFPVD